MPATAPRLATLAAALAALPAAAQESTGEITATIGGEQRTWYVTESDRMSQSDWSGSPNWASVSLFGHTAPDTVMTSKQALMIGFTATGTGAASDPEIGYLSESMSKAWVSDDTATVTIDSMTAEGDRLSLTGSFTATMGYSEDYGRTVDTSDPREISGRFDVSVGPVR